MSWLRSAVNKAVEVGNSNNLARAVRSYAGQAVASGARIIQDSIGARNYKSKTQTIKKLEEAAVTCRGLERVQLLRTWLSVLHEIQKSSASLGKHNHINLEQDIISNESNDSPGRPSLVLFYDPDSEVEPMNFRDVFLHSQALEGIILSMILEAPNQEEVSLLLDLFGLCLLGGKEIHNAIVNNIQHLAKVFSSYEDEVLAKREELLQFAQGAIAGLKINADLGRIDAEASTLQQKLERISASWDYSREHNGEAPEKITLSLEAQEEALAHMRVCSRLEVLLLKKKMLSNGDPPNIHDQKVDKLKVLSESLISSATKAEKRISDGRVQKEEALRFRAAKSNEVIELEKELAAEIAGLEKQKDELEAELKKVTISLAAARAHLHKTEEERHQFDEASNQIVVHLKAKEDELSRSMAACSVEADVVKTWIQFLEDTWAIQCSLSNTKENQVNDELQRHEDYYMNLVINLLSAYKEELMPLINYVGKFVKKFKTLCLGSEVSPNDSEASKMMNHRIFFEEYLAYQAKITTTFSVVDNMKGMFYAQRGKINREDDSRVNELFDDIDKLRAEFGAFERPTLETETPTTKVDATSSENLKERSNGPSMKASEMVKVEKSEQPSLMEAEQMHVQPEPERETPTTKVDATSSENPKERSNGPSMKASESVKVEKSEQPSLMEAEQMHVQPEPGRETPTTKVDATSSENPKERSNGPSMKASEMVKVEKSEQPSLMEAEQMHVQPDPERETATTKVDATSSENPKERSNGPSMKASEMVKVEKSEQPSLMEAEQMHVQPEPEREL